VNKLLSFDKSAVTNFSVLAHVPIYCALSQFLRKYDQWWENYCWLCYVYKEALWKNYYRSQLSGPLLSANVRFIEYQITNSITCTLSFICEVQLLDSNYGFVWHGKDNICKNEFYLLHFMHDTKGNNPQRFKILICLDKREPKKKKF